MSADSQQQPQQAAPQPAGYTPTAPVSPASLDEMLRVAQLGYN